MPDGATGNSGGDDFDVVVVGGGNAAFCAALSSQEQGARVVVTEGRISVSVASRSRCSSARYCAMPPPLDKPTT